VSRVPPFVHRDEKVDVVRISDDEIAVFVANTYHLLANAKRRIGRWEIQVDARAATAQAVIDFFKALTSADAAQGGGA
jgi:hypothetical protein